MIYQATIEKVFSAAHALRLPGGSLEPIHGHDFRVTVTVQAATLDAMDTVMDFHVLETLVESTVGPWRNQLLNEVAPFAGGPGDDHGLAVNPSAERIAQQVAQAAADQVLAEADRQGDALVDAASGALAKSLAEKAADALRQQARKKSRQILARAETEADRILASAEEKANSL